MVTEVAFLSTKPKQKNGAFCSVFFGKKKGTRRDLKGEARTRESGLRQGEKETEGGRANCTALRAVHRGAPQRRKSLRPHQTEKRSFLLRFLFGKKKGTRRDLKGEART